LYLYINQYLNKATNDLSSARSSSPTSRKSSANDGKSYTLAALMGDAGDAEDNGIGDEDDDDDVRIEWAASVCV
jgi:hypothetical protein